MSLQVCGCCGWSKTTTYHGLRTHQGKMGCTPKGLRIPESEQYRYSSYTPKVTYVPPPPVKVEKPFMDLFPTSTKPVAEQNTWKSSWIESPLRDSKPKNSSPVWNETFLRALPESFSTQLFPVKTETNISLFETPPRLHQTSTSARRALDFSSDAQQVGQLVWDIQTITAQDTLFQPKEEREEERKAQRLLKERQDRTRADLQQKIQMRKEKMAEVKSSAKVCKGSLDSEWMEINNVFSEVIRVVEDARRKALKPVEERSHRLQEEEQQLVKKLQKEIDTLRATIDELDRNPDLQVSPPTGLDKSQDWKFVTLDSSISLGTLRSKTSYMMEQIHQKLEKLSSLELKRIPTFAVDVKLDPATAHQCLVLSPDGKEVKDGGKIQKAPDTPEKFDMYGSILGLNRLTSGKAYWEVEVSNKTGWDLGVARHDANRKGILSLNPDNGYWVTVHYENKKYAALTAPPVSLSLTVKPKKVGVFVDYEEGLVSFYDVTSQSHIYSFTKCLFSGKIFPYFSPHLEQNGKNPDPLIISAVKKQR